jgi:hypothetical protein
MESRSRCLPDVTKNVLLLTAGLVWIGVGALLLALAFSWLAAASDVKVYLFAGPGVVCALLVHHFGFLKIVDRNLSRIRMMGGKASLWSFIPSRSYLLIAVMMSMGALLRHSAIPKRYLAILYISIGLALVLSSVRYLRVLVTELISQKNSPKTAVR